MTIRLEWWIIPILLILVGLVGAWWDEKFGGGGYIGGLAGCAFAIICFVSALAFTVGHFL